MQFSIEMQWRRGTGQSGFAGSGVDGLAMQGDTVDILGNPNAPIGAVRFETGDGKSYLVKMTVDSSAASSEDFIHGVARVTHSYQAPRSGTMPWTATLKGCCRPGTYSTKTFQLTTTLDLTLANRSPAFRSLPVVTVAKTNTTMMGMSNMSMVPIILPARDSMGMSARYWRMAQGAELGTLMPLPAAAVSFKGTDYLSGRLTVDTAHLDEGSYPVVVQASVPGAMVPVDFMLKVVSAADRAMMPNFVGDVGDSSASMGMREMTGYVGYEVFFTVEAISPRPMGSIAEIRSFFKPVGLFMSNSREIMGEMGNSRAIDVRWTPASDQVTTLLDTNL